MPSGSKRPAGPNGGVSQMPANGGNAAADFLQNRDRPTASTLPAGRPAAGNGQLADNRTDRRDNISNNRTDRQDTVSNNRNDRQDSLSNNRTDRQDSVSNNRSDRTDNRSDRTDNRQNNTSNRQESRSDRLDTRNDNLTNYRADRIDNVQQRTVDRVERRDQVRDQVRDNYPRGAFWADHPYWAQWRWTAPYRYTTWAVLSNWAPWRSNTVTSYNYGDNIYYEGGDVYYGDSIVASEQVYAEQAQAIVATAPEPTTATAAQVSQDDWMPLGVFAITADGEASGPPPSLFLQLAVSKDGVIAGTLCKNDTDQVDQVEGAVDMESQRTAWGVSGKDWPIMEAGLSNLTGDTCPVLLHFADGQTQQYLLVRVEDDPTK
ncbi:MAG: hypothetical protein GY904_36395 [Planctomycetaceae bacterium]|nr:hypothetical protein [Planctomycetaceae bacterium]